MTASRLITTIAATSLLTACASTPTESAGIRLRVIEINQTAPADAPFLYLRGELVNTGTEPFVNGGCTRPTIEIDSLGPTGWVTVPSLQSDELIVCIRAYTVDPGGTAQFETTVVRPNRSWYPTRTRLRVRIPVGPTRDGPSAEFMLSQ